MGWLANWRERREGRRVLAGEAHGPTITHEQADHLSTVDFGQSTIKLDDPNDATSVMAQLVMQGHAVMMSQSGPRGEWVIQINGDEREWVHQHQIVALTRALRDVQDDDKRGTT